jgi:prophage regulatory protein
MMTTSTTLPETGFVRLPTVLKVFPVSRSAWWKGIADGRYPPGVKLSARTTAWPVAAIRELIERAGTTQGGQHENR